MTPFEISLLFIQSVQSIAVGVFAIKYVSKAPEKDGLEPGRSRLKIKYFWLNEEFEGEPTASDLIESERDYEYMVEGTEILVSREGSFDVTLASGEEEPTDSGMANRAIRPPSGWRRPPVAKLMAIELSVVS